MFIGFEVNLASSSYGGYGLANAQVEFVIRVAPARMTALQNRTPLPRRLRMSAHWRGPGGPDGDYTLSTRAVGSQ
jgi:hypothetical protein